MYLVQNNDALNLNGSLIRFWSNNCHYKFVIGDYRECSNLGAYENVLFNENELNILGDFNV